MYTSPVLSDLLAYLQESPTPFHAVEASITRLEAAGFKRLDERAAWGRLEAGGYYVEQSDTALVAFTIADPEKARSFRLLGAHTDSPSLRLKPAGVYKKEGYAQLAVEVYGGALLNSWLDRDLSLAGRVVVKEDDGRLDTRLVRFDRPVARVAQLAIHLDREVNDKGLILNKQDHMPPILGLAGEETTLADLKALCAQQIGIAPEQVLRTDLMLHDAVPPVQGGLDGEFIFAACLDNLAMCHAAIQALKDKPAAAPDQDTIGVAVLFDHEEVGSASATGAGSEMLPRLLERITLALGRSREEHHMMIASSLCLSADMAHAVHPNYADRHEARHRPAINKGPVIKINTQQRYATCTRTATLFEQICREAEVPVQSYVHRTDLQCGSTIGPITSTLLGIRTVDVGNPMLSMHSIREMGGSEDPDSMVKAMRGFLNVPTGKC